MKKLLNAGLLVLLASSAHALSKKEVGSRGDLGSANAPSSAATPREVSGQFEPRRLVHSLGSAATECQDPVEQQQRYFHRAVCVNSGGDFHFIEDGTELFPRRRLIHSNGKAPTECLDAAEQIQGLRERAVCVNARGEYYFLAD